MTSDATQLDAIPVRRLPVHFDRFDGIRALAALSVLVFHAVDVSTKFDTAGGRFLWNLNVGVWVFFVTSGFLLYRPFAAAHLGEGGPVRLRGYAARRIMRIYPAYWAVLAFFTFVVARAQISGVDEAIGHLTLTHTYAPNQVFRGIPVAWSLVVELSFYAFLPVYAAVVGWAGRRLGAARAEAIGLVVLAATGVVALGVMAAGGAPPWVIVLPRHLHVFALGMGLAVLSAGNWSERVRDWVAWAGQRPALWWSGALLVFLAIPVVIRTQPYIGPTSTQIVALDLCDALVGFLVVVPATLAGGPSSVVDRLLRTRALVSVGLISYGVYLWHQFVLAIVAEDVLGREVARSWPAVLVVGLPIVLGAATVTYFLVEQPAMQLARGHAVPSPRAFWTSLRRGRRSPPGVIVPPATSTATPG